jgi:GNAT superfamily N-acetyltransferase
MESRLSFRLANPADAELLGQLNFRLIRDEGHRNPMSEPELAHRMREWLLSGEYQAAIFFLDADLVAYVLWRKEGSDQVYLRQFFVARDWRRRGIGKAAFHLFVEELLPASTRIKVDVLCGNPAGLSFWRSLGFRDYALSLEREGDQCSGLSI